MSDPTEGQSLDQPDDAPGTPQVGVPPASDRQWLDMLQQAVDAIMIRLEKLEFAWTAESKLFADFAERVEGLEQFKTQVEIWVGDFEQRMEKLMAKPKSKARKPKAKPRTVVRQGAREGGKVDKGRSFRGAVPSGKKSRARR